MAKLVIIKPNDVKTHSQYLYEYKLKKYALHASLVINILLIAAVIYGRK